MTRPTREDIYQAAKIFIPSFLEQKGIQGANRAELHSHTYRKLEIKFSSSSKQDIFGYLKLSQLPVSTSDNIQDVINDLYRKGKIDFRDGIFYHSNFYNRTLSEKVRLLFKMRKL